jgi:glycosyltransferase involved in cell wall biosynthesis
MTKKLIIFMPSIEGGGVEKNLFIIGNYLSNKVKNISLITCSLTFKKKFNNKIKFISPKYNFWDKMNRKFKYIVCIYLLIKTIIREKNILVFSFQANIYSSIICKLFNIKIIIRSNSSPTGWSTNIFKRIIFTNFYKFANENIVNSERFRDELNKKFNIKSICIYNPLDLKKIKEKSNKKIKKKIYKKRNSLKLINIGRLTYQKDQFTLLKAAKILKKNINFELLIIGNGSEYHGIKQYIRENKLEKFVKILNFQENPYPYIKASDIFILSSRYEGLPNVLLESLALKKFVISSNCPTGPSEILDNGKGGLLFRVGDQKGLVKKINYFLKNKKICEKKLKFSQKRLIRFDLNFNLDKYYKIIEKYLH